MSLEKFINANRSKLSENDLDILSYILTNKETIAHLGIHDLSIRSHTSKSTIVRLTQKLGFSGFSEFKYYLKNEKKKEILPTKNNLSLLESDINETMSLIAQTNMHPLCEAISLANRVFIYGTGWGEKKAADDFTRNFMSCNVFIIPIPSVTELNWNIDSFTKNDLVIFISFSGENLELEDNITKLKLHGVPFCSVTPLRQNYLSSQATYKLYYQVTQLQIDNDPDKEYNFFITLNIVIDSLFRFYLDNYF
ncbi:MurR/RpiR family transcriptional regulator [Carnobacterium mobile]|uniref:MurR/RpiR family transcriptional regulator n=1 Tax=Carnobacterium mobile TaxID=2750 RepID=UPI0018684C86|nr:MurR/RpiR family transcriptional regulator [Carnobacterium mobile]